MEFGFAPIQSESALVRHLHGVKRQHERELERGAGSVEQTRGRGGHVSPAPGRSVLPVPESRRH